MKRLARHSQEKEGKAGLDTFVFTPMISTNEINERANELMRLQLEMATHSINHEYARIELDESHDRLRHEELLEYMAECRRKYFEARQALAVMDPQGLADFEADLIYQKRTTLAGHQA